MTGSSNSKLNQELGSTFTTHHQDYAVRQIGISEYLPAAKSLAEAFKNDAVAGYIVGTNGSEQCLTGEAYKLNHDILKYVTAAHCYKGLVTTIGPNYDAVALW